MDSAGPPDPAATWEETLPINADFDAPWVAAAVAWIVDRQRPRSAVDVGCGAGGAACALAAALGPSGRVSALDVDPRLVVAARRRAADAGVSGRIGFAVGDVGAPCVRPGSVELVWASGVVHHLADQQAGVDRLVALLAPGGRLALVESGLPMRCLPHEIGIGRPGLEARLDEARARWFVELRHGLGGVALPYGWPEALRRAGLVDVATRSFVVERTTPLDDVGRRIVRLHLTSAATELAPHLGVDDLAVVRRLLDPDDPACVERRTDVFPMAVRTLHVGVRPPG
ncbi:MAG TPA: class I SAM-dependent methyltransferase [Acidimicrobiales bacterium]|nr:class I SAM-dependent methyltransferase [Acidimicrobiales bacterium]